MKRRVVVTGFGAITPVGNDVESTWAAILAGKSGAAPITKFDTANFPVTFACEVKGFDASMYMDRKEAKRADMYTQYAVGAAVQAMKDAGLDETNMGDPDRIGVILGSTIGGRITLRFGIDRMLLAATPLAAAAGLVMAALAWSDVHHVAAIIAPMFVYTLALGIILSQSIAGAVSPFPQIAGIASALLGFLQMTLASLAGLAVGQLYDASERPMATVIALMGVASMATYWLLVWRRQRRPA